MGLSNGFEVSYVHGGRQEAAGGRLEAIFIPCIELYTMLVYTVTQFRV